MLGSPEDSNTSIFTESLDEKDYSVKKSLSSSESFDDFGPDKNKFGSLMDIMYGD